MHRTSRKHPKAPPLCVGRAALACKIPNSHSGRTARTPAAAAVQHCTMQRKFSPSKGLTQWVCRGGYVQKRGQAGLTGSQDGDSDDDDDDDGDGEAVRTPPPPLPSPAGACV